MKHIFFDIDRTIFNTDSWYETNRLKVVELFNSKYLTDGISTYEIFIGLLKQRGINKNTNIKKTIVELSQVLKLDEKEFLDDMIDIILTEDYTKLVYDGVFDFLEEIFGKFRVGIFSEGDPWFQNIKLDKSGLSKYFVKERKYYFKNKLVNIAALPTGCVLFDDSDKVGKAIECQRKDIIFKKVNKNYGIGEFNPVDIINEFKGMKYYE